MDRQFPGATLVSINAIAVGPRMRGTNPRQVAVLMDSINTTGLINPIGIFPLPEPKGEKLWGLIAGAHRLEAYKGLGHAAIPVHVVDLDELHRQIAECDENLCGAKLTPAESATLTARRKQAYEALHPETRNGAAGNGRGKLRQLGEATRFTADTAQRTGKSERGVQRDAERGDAIAPEILQEVRHSEFDKGTVLDALAATPRNQQPAKLAEIRSKSREKVKRGRQAGDVGPLTSRQVSAPGASTAAAWIVEQLGEAKAALLADMLAKEDLGMFLRHLRNIAGLSDRPGPAADVGRELPGGSLSSVGSDLIGSTKVLGTDVILALDAQRPDGGPVPSSEEAIGPGGAADLARHDPRRSSNWRDVTDEPEDGDWCRECKGTNWWCSSSERPGWYCVSCFDPRNHRGDRLLRSTAPAASINPPKD